MFHLLKIHAFGEASLFWTFSNPARVHTPLRPASAYSGDRTLPSLRPRTLPVELPDEIRTRARGVPFHRTAALESELVRCRGALPRFTSGGRLATRGEEVPSAIQFAY